jgi:hypothetical protein
VKDAVHHEGHSGQIAGVLKHRDAEEHEHDDRHKTEHPADAVDYARGDHRLQRPVREEGVYAFVNKREELRQPVNQHCAVTESKGVEAEQDRRHNQRSEDAVGDDFVDLIRGVEPVGDKFTGNDALVDDRFDVPVTVVGNHRFGVNTQRVLQMICHLLAAGGKFFACLRIGGQCFLYNLFIVFQQFDAEPAFGIDGGQLCALPDIGRHVGEGFVYIRAVAEECGLRRCR